MLIIVSFVSVFCSALLVSFGIPNEYFHFGSALIGLVSLIPLYTAFLSGTSRKQAACMYGLMVALVHLFSSFWLVYFQDFAIFTLGASTVAYFCLGLPFGIWFHYAMKLPGSLRAFAFAGLWTLWEWFKSSGFVAYPWGSLAMTSLSLRPFIQIADITGVWGITALLALISALLAELIAVKAGLSTGLSKKLIRPVLFTGALLILINGYGLYRLCEKRVPEKSITLALVQQNTDPWVFDNFFKNLGEIQELTEKAVRNAPVRPDLIVWSESSLVYGYDTFKDYYQRLPESESFVRFLQRMNIPILVGSPLRRTAERDAYSNSVYLLASDGEIIDTYSKIQLVCFAEYIPFIDHPLVQQFFSSLVGFSSGWTPGSVYKALPLTLQNGQKIRFAAPICFEDAFPSLCAHLHNQQSDLLINLTNDSWSKTASAEYQHFAIAYFRAIELRTPLVRATNGGYTVVVDPVGRIIADLPLFTAASTSVTIPLYARQQTFYARWKDWLPALFLALAIAAAIKYRCAPSFKRTLVVYRKEPLAFLVISEKKRRRRMQLWKKRWFRKHLR